NRVLARETPGRRTSLVHVTLLTDESTRCDLQPVDAHFAEAYRELRKMARLRLRAGRPDALMVTTALVHESYLRLAACVRLPLKCHCTSLGCTRLCVWL